MVVAPNTMASESLVMTAFTTCSFERAVSSASASPGACCAVSQVDTVTVQRTYIYPREPQMVEHLLYCHSDPVVVALNSLPSLLVRSLPSIEDKDRIYWQLEQVAAACKEHCQLRALGIAMMIACSIDPTTNYILC